MSRFVICPCYEKSRFASFEGGGVGRVLESPGPQQHAIDQ